MSVSSNPYYIVGCIQLSSDLFRSEASRPTVYTEIRHDHNHCGYEIGLPATKGEIVWGGVRSLVGLHRLLLVRLAGYRKLHLVG